MKKYTENLSRFLSIALFISIFLLEIPSALALGQVALTVKNPDPYKGNHSWFIYEKEAGQTIEDVASLKNFGDEPASVTIYAVDATSSDTGGYILKFREEEQKSIGYWTDVEVKEATILPNEVIDVPFEIVLPENVTPGEYIGGLVVEAGDLPEFSEEQQRECEENNLCGASIEVKTRVGTRIYLTVPGRTFEDFALTDVKASKSITGITQFQLRIENNGNVAYEPKAVIDVYDSVGNLYEHIEKNLGTSSPGSVIHPMVKMKNRPLIGNFTANVTVTFDRKFGDSEFHAAAPTEEMEVTFWVMPWEIILGALLIILAISGMIFQRKRAWSAYMANAEEYTVAKSDDIERIAEDRNIEWHKLAKFNRLKPPYIVRGGDKLMVPKKK